MTSTNYLKGSVCCFGTKLFIRSFTLSAMIHYRHEYSDIYQLVILHPVLKVNMTLFLIQVCPVCLHLLYIYMNTRGHALFSYLDSIIKSSWVGGMLD